MMWTIIDTVITISAALILVGVFYFRRVTIKRTKRKKENWIDDEFVDTHLPPQNFESQTDSDFTHHD